MGDFLPFVDLGEGVLAKSVSLGARHTCAVVNDGDVKCWGECFILAILVLVILVLVILRTGGYTDNGDTGTGGDIDIGTGGYADIGGDTGTGGAGIGDTDGDSGTGTG